MKKAYCVDLKNFKVTGFDCPCSPSGMNRHEFAAESDDPAEIRRKAEEITDGKPVTFCEHVRQ